ncbi:MAG: flagellar basal body P-ring formation chaperone FlgA [Caldimicrobium sp.]|nr:flagellar basal body P-ring formation chaperone FlgA [Caldimicrobium sp.]MCX7873558.1 flagellar basal body P-ring formation chaperone FlgA [Caldimicrobium sp.]MDW8094057.1 flagellar basal body P-ring formation chaperone FlgA [Caldimicrobium sp.]
MKILLLLIPFLLVFSDLGLANYYEERDYREIFLQEIRSALKDLSGEIFLERFRVETSERAVPKGTPYKFEWIGKPKAGSNFALLIFQVKGTENRILRLWGYVEVKVPVVTLKKDVGPKTVLTEDEIEMEVKALSRLPHDVFFRREEVLGKETRMGLKAGTVLRSSYLTLPTLVKRNQEVEIIAKGQAFMVKAKGVALQNGRLSEFIKVKNLSSQRVIQAKVVAEGIVEVSF